jgi:molybdopterin-synthase adenylyltransferase
MGTLDSTDVTDSPLDRYRRQTQFAPLGREGQDRLQASAIAICGCGALGSVLAERLLRAGVGRIRLIDRDWVEWDNLPRQTLFTERDAADRVPKAVAAAEKLQLINSQTQIDIAVADLTHRSVYQHLHDVDLILDGTDNFETRYLINDFALANNKPWVHGGCIGAQGQVLPIVPGKTACFRCLMPDMPTADSVGTCDTVGVLGPAVSMIASCQAIEAIKILAQRTNETLGQLQIFDMWRGTQRMISLAALQAGEQCPACGLHDYEFLEGRRSAAATILCGKNAVQIQAPTSQRIDLLEMAARLAVYGPVHSNPFMIRVQVEAFHITLFADGRAIIAGTEDTAMARSLYARIIGS